MTTGQQRSQSCDTSSVLPGFENYQRYWSKRHDCYAVNVKPGEFYVTAQSEAITTLLGSCISACIRDPIAGIGGINHFILPAEGGSKFFDSDSARYGAYAMEQLINTLMKFGGSKSRMEVKITGGASLIKGCREIGAYNIQFVLDYIKKEGLKLLSSDVGGEQARHVVYLPQSGRLLVKKLNQTETQPLSAEEARYQKQIKNSTIGGEVELF